MILYIEDHAMFCPPGLSHERNRGIDWLPRRVRLGNLSPLELAAALSCRRVWIRAEVDWNPE